MRGLEAEQVEEVARHDEAVDELGRVVGIEAGADAAPRRQSIERVSAVAQRGEHRVGEHAADAAAVDVDEAIPVGDGQMLKQRRVDEAEDRGVRADAEGECQDGGEGKARLLAQHARGVARVQPEIGDQESPLGPWCDGRREPRLAQGRHIARERVGFEQFVNRQAKRHVVALAVGAQLVEPFVEVLRQLLDDLGLARRAQAERRQSRAKVRGPFTHDRLP